MKIYKFGYYTEEESPYCLLTCVNDYTEEQFKNLCADLYVEAYKEYKESLGEWGKEFAVDTVDNLFNVVLEKLIVKFGFNEIKSDCTFNPFGWDSLERNKWTVVKSEDLELIRTKVNKNCSL